MPARLEVWEIFLDHEIQMAQTVGWKDGNAKIRELAVTRGGFAEFLFSYKIALHRQNPLGAHSSPLKKYFSFHIRRPRAQQPALGEIYMLLALKPLGALGGQGRQPSWTS